MAQNTQRGQELKGMAAAVIAGLIAVALSFGVGAAIRSVTAQPNRGEASASARTAASGPPGYTAQMITTGQQLFGPNCASCHGATAAGGFGPNLRNLNGPDSKIGAVITNGRDQMPAFGKRLSKAQIHDLVGYIKSLA